MTQQQIGYMNAVTARENLDIARTQADAAQKQAAAALKSANVAESRQKYDFWTGLAATGLGLLGVALL